MEIDKSQNLEENEFAQAWCGQIWLWRECLCVYVTNPSATNEPLVHTAGFFLNGKQFYRVVA